MRSFRADEQCLDVVIRPQRAAVEQNQQQDAC
jgi:hypothetical protein